MYTTKEMFDKADELFKEKNYEDSKTIYFSILDKSKNDIIKCYCQIAECYFYEKNLDKVIEYYEMSFNLDPIPDNILRLVNICFTFKDYDLVYKYSKLLIETIKELEKKNNHNYYIGHYDHAISFLEILADNFDNKESRKYLKELNK